MESVIVLGLGEVGRPLYGIIRSSSLYRVYGCDIIKKM
jgi:saccharopine dehydrogenase-like NADP-dependent oxidoreductase